MRQLFVDDNFFPTNFKRVRQKTHKKFNKSVDTIFFFHVEDYFVPPHSIFFFFLCIIQREKENTQRKTHAWVSVETRKKHLQEEQHAVHRARLFI